MIATKKLFSYINCECINLKKRLNPYTILAMISSIFTVMHISPSAMTSWPVLFDALQDLLSSPFLLMTYIITVIGIIHDPTTKGLKDSQAILSAGKKQDS